MKEKMAMIGKKFFVALGGVWVTCEITDFKTSYGRDRWQIKPVAGKGTVWVESLGDEAKG